MKNEFSLKLHKELLEHERYNAHYESTNEYGFNDSWVHIEIFMMEFKSNHKKHIPPENLLTWVFKDYGERKYTKDNLDYQEYLQVKSIKKGCAARGRAISKVLQPGNLYSQPEEFNLQFKKRNLQFANMQDLFSKHSEDLRIDLKEKEIEAECRLLAEEVKIYLDKEGNISTETIDEGSGWFTVGIDKSKFDKDNQEDINRMIELIRNSITKRLTEYRIKCLKEGKPIYPQG
jgi:hypothetical protein